MSNLRPNDQRGKKAIALIWISLIMNCVVSFYNMGTLIINQYLIDDGYTEAVMSFFNVSYYVIKTISLLYIFVLIFSIISFIKWFRRAYYNLNILTNECMYSDNMAAKCWFIPFVNLYVPYLMMKEMYEKTDTYLFERHISFNNYEFPLERLNTNLVKWWWTLFITTGIIIYGTQFMIVLFAPEATFGIVLNLPFSIIRFALLALLSMTTIFVIKNYQKAENNLIQ